MEISKIEKINLSDYKLAYYTGDSLGHDRMSQDQVMQLVDWWGTYYDELFIALIPKQARLTECSGDDWDDFCARDNASWFYRYPEWTIFLQWNLWQELKLVDRI